jgi:ribonuclease T2
MPYHHVRRVIQATAIAISFCFVFAVIAFAQDGRANQPGKFDYYVLSLSWSPTYCAGEKDRGSGRRPDPQCSGRPFAFIVHGLWPQYVKGFPAYCQVPAPRIGRDMVDGMLDLMPSRHLIYHEWDRHGTCSGLSAQSYFATLRKARAAVTIPEAFRDPAAPLTVTPGDVVAAFVKANPGLSAGDMAVSCGKARLREVRLCLGKNLSFHDCAAVAGRSCKREKIVMPAVRGG